MAKRDPIYGIMAEFDSAQALVDARVELKDRLVRDGEFEIDEVGDVRAVLPAPASLAGLKGIKRGAVEQTLLCSRA